MKMTLLELVQRVLESIDSDEVSSIADTTEALAVANIVKEAYWDIISEITLKESSGLFQLTPSTDPDMPTVAYRPANVSKIWDLRYNVGETLDDVNLVRLEYVPVGDFFERMNGLNPNEPWVSTQEVPMDGSVFHIKYRNDKYPTFWTSPDDHTLIFDSFNSGTESTITAARSYGFGELIPVFQMDDDYVPDLDAKHFPLLLQSAKATASVELKQVENPRAERKERRHRILAYKENDSTDTRPEIFRRRGFGRYGR